MKQNTKNTVKNQMTIVTEIVTGVDLKNTEDQLNRTVQPWNSNVIIVKNQITLAKFVNGVTIDMLTDSGAMVSMISSQHVKTFLPNVS